MIDKGKDTREHIEQVQLRMDRALADWALRMRDHDASKLEEPELTGFWEMNKISRRKDVEYRSAEYKALMASQQGVIDHHYDKNDHHPEHYYLHPSSRHTCTPDINDRAENGWLISGMTLNALQEMVCDWSAASARYKDGSFAKSFEANCMRFGIVPQLACILWNTAVALGLITPEENDMYFLVGEREAKEAG